MWEALTEAFNDSIEIGNATIAGLMTRRWLVHSSHTYYSAENRPSRQHVLR